MWAIQDGFSVMQGGKTCRAPVADIVYIKLFVGGLFFGFFKKKFAILKSMEKTKYKGH